MSAEAVASSSSYNRTDICQWEWKWDRQAEELSLLHGGRKYNVKQKRPEQNVSSKDIPNQGPEPLR